MRKDALSTFCETLTPWPCSRASHRGVSAQERAAERRERLLEATLGVWADPEVSTTMTNVCARAGLSERYFYESFCQPRRRPDRGARPGRHRDRDEDPGGRGPGRAGPAARALASVSAFVQLLVDDPRRGRVAIVEAAAMPSLRPRRTELMRHFAHRTAESARELGLSPLGGPEDELAGLLFIGGVAELVTAWLDGVVDATPTSWSPPPLAASSRSTAEGAVDGARDRVRGRPTLGAWPSPCARPPALPVPAAGDPVVLSGERVWTPGSGGRTSRRCATSGPCWSATSWCSAPASRWRPRRPPPTTSCVSWSRSAPPGWSSS